MENPFKHMLGKEITKEPNPELDLKPTYREPNRAERRERSQKRFWMWRSRHRRDGSRVRDRWEWKPTQRPPYLRKERNRRRNKMAYVSRVRDRWEWKPTQRSPYLRKERNRRRNKMAHASRVRDRWEWKPTQRPPHLRKERNRRRNKMAHASRVKNR